MAGVVSHADWVFIWSLPMSGSLAGGGLHIMCASFQQRAVLLNASQPFILVPYHGTGPKFKDGLQHQGAPFTPLKPDAPNRHGTNLPPGAKATLESEAVVVEKLAPTETEPARAIVWAKFQAWNYQYLQEFEFRADGMIEFRGGMGGPLYPLNRSFNHVHNFYYRLDFALGSGGNQVVERQEHVGGVDNWVAFTNEGKDTFNPAQNRRWRIRHLRQRNANGMPISYEIVPGTVDPPDGTHSTGDFWVVRRKGMSTDMGHEIGKTDSHLAAGYGSGAPLAGQDVILWYVMREHHTVAPQGEDKLTVPYHALGFHLRPRDFLDDTPTNLYKTSPVSPP